MSLVLEIIENLFLSFIDHFFLKSFVFSVVLSFAYPLAKYGLRYTIRAVDVIDVDMSGREGSAQIIIAISMLVWTTILVWLSISSDMPWTQALTVGVLSWICAAGSIHTLMRNASQLFKRMWLLMSFFLFIFGALGIIALIVTGKAEAQGFGYVFMSVSGAFGFGMVGSSFAAAGLGMLS